MKNPPNDPPAASAEQTGDAPREGELILYRDSHDVVRVEVLYESDTFG